MIGSTFGIQLPFKTKLEPEVEPKTEQKALKQQDEVDTQLVDSFSSSLNYLGIRDADFSSINELIKTYRAMARNFEVSETIDEVENDAVVVEDDESVSFNTDRLEFSEKIKKDLQEEFNGVLKLLDWNAKGSEIFRQWFIDGRIYYQKVMFSNTQDGIEEVVKLDPLKLKKYKDKDTDRKWYVYNYSTKEKYEIPNDAIAYSSSGLLDHDRKYTISELHNSLRPLNNLRLMEDSALIYYYTRAPQKRAFYIDVGGAPTKKAEEAVLKIMQKHRQRFSFDSISGEIKQQKRSIPVNEDYYFPTRAGSKSTTVDVLSGDTSLLDTDILNYFKKKLYKSLSVPFARMDEDSGATISFGEDVEMSRQEHKFAKQTKKRRKRFSMLFDDLLKTQLIAKNIISFEDWDEIRHLCYYVWKDDTLFTMMKQQSIMKSQVEVAELMQEYVGKYFSNEYIRREIFKQTDVDIELLDKQIEEEKNDPRYAEPAEEEE